MMKVSWKLWVRAKDKDKALRVFGAMQKEMPCEVSISDVEKYWKIPELQIIEFTSPILSKTKEEAVYSILMLAQYVASGWVVKGPFEYENGTTEFRGSYSKRQGSQEPLENAEFEIRWQERNDAI